MTGQDNLGYTDLLDQQHVPKYDLRVEILGTLDEASSILGVARATTPHEQTAAIVLQIQHDLCWMMSELAAATDEARPNIHITPERVGWLTGVMAGLRIKTDQEPDFASTGDNSSSSFIQLARAVVRRAERQVALLDHQGTLHNPQIMTYLNRLSTLLFRLGHHENLI